MKEQTLLLLDQLITESESARIFRKIRLAKTSFMRRLCGLVPFVGLVCLLLGSDSQCAWHLSVAYEVWMVFPMCAVVASGLLRRKGDA